MLKMVNAWSLAASVLDGTLDEDYPIMTKAETTITPQESDEYDPPKAKPEPITSLETEDTDDVVNVPLGDVNLDEISISTNEYGYEHSPYYYDYNRNDPDRKNPFTDAFDYMMGETVVGGGNTASADTSNSYCLDDDGYPSEFTTLSDNDDQIAHHIGLNNEDQKSETMENIREASERKRDGRYKYHEAEIIQEIEDYVSSTYNGHYTGTKHEYRNVQTIDLMASRDLAAAFCQSNILKYGSRYGSKEGRNKKDLLKVIHYAMLLLHFDEHYGKPSMTSGNIDHNMP